jgi:lysyl-tRNA synthetase, class II
MTTHNSSSIDAQRALRIEKLSTLRTIGIDPFPATSKREFTLSFVSFWFDFVEKYDLPSRIVELQKTLSPELEFNSDAVIADFIISQAFYDYSIEEAHEFTIEWIEQQDNANELLVNYEAYYAQRSEIIEDIMKFLEENSIHTKEQKIELISEYFMDADFGGDSAPQLVKNQKVWLAGRLKTKRGSGKIAFAVVEDESLPSGFQFLFKSDLVKEETSKQYLSFEQFKELIDEGDYIEAYGNLEYSQRGEPSLFVESFKILTKSLRPLPDALEDVETKLRQRYIDMKLNPEVREMFVKKSKFWSATRGYLVSSGFLEVQAPTLEETTGGAEAAAFETHHNALDEDFYLRISSELHLKRYIVGGFEKVFDIDKNYRNEGIDDEHLQEYTQMEFYWAYASFEDLVRFSEGLFKHVIEQTFDTSKLNYQDTVVDWSTKWSRLGYYEFVEKYAGIKLAEYDTVEKLRDLATTLGLHYDEHAGYGRLVDLIYKKTARPKCIEPTWLIDIPVELSPLAKRDPKNPSNTLRCQLIAYGSELCNGYSELNDPLDQLARFEEQQELRVGGDDEAMMIDHDFVNALEIGMPPTVGFGFSERLFSVLMQKSIRETTPFPLMKRKKNTHQETGE